MRKLRRRSASDWNVGGFIGFVSQDTTISNCVSYSKVTTTLSLDRPIRTGGFIGTNNGSTIKNSHAAGTVSATQAGNVIGGFEGYDISGTTEKCSFDADKNTEMNAIGGTESAGTNDISTEATKKVMSNICVDYYGSHDYNTDEYIVDSQPDCTNDGSKSYHCRRCDSSDETSSVAIGKTGHSLKKTDKKDATCTEDGYEAYWTCEKCERIFSDEAAENEITAPVVIPATGEESGGASSDNTPSDSSNTGSDNNGTSSPENSCESSSESGNSDQSTVPKTADGTDVALILALVIISGLAFAAVLVVLRKRENA